MEVPVLTDLQRNQEGDAPRIVLSKGRAHNLFLQKAENWR